MDVITSDHQEQYFDTGVVNINKDEIFVDGGAWQGDTIEKITSSYLDKFQKIYSFEPDGENFAVLKDKLKNYTDKNIVLEKKGLFNYTGFVDFISLGSPESYISNNNIISSFSGDIDRGDIKTQVTKLPVVTIDQYFKDKEPPTFIKMDIEGAEISALAGARKTISRHRPKLAICIYHKPNDLWEIPLLIKKMNDRYKIYIRHYSQELGETVCYAM